MSGHAALHLHYYENDPNQHLRARREFEVQNASTAEEKVNVIVAGMEERYMSYEDKVAKAICKKIEFFDQQVYEQLQQEVIEQVQEKMRRLRRILPVTKTRFKWDAAAQRQITLLNDRKVDNK